MSETEEFIKTEVEHVFGTQNAPNLQLEVPTESGIHKVIHFINGVFRTTDKVTADWFHKAIAERPNFAQLVRHVPTEATADQIAAMELARQKLQGGAVRGAMSSMNNPAAPTVMQDQMRAMGHSEAEIDKAVAELNGAGLTLTEQVLIPHPTTQASAVEQKTVDTASEIDQRSVSNSSTDVVTEPVVEPVQEPTNQSNSETAPKSLADLTRSKQENVQ